MDTHFNSGYKLYILMRTDMPSLNSGKAMAQACHAANQFIHVYGKRKTVKQWQDEAYGFGTTIVLSVTRRILLNLNNACNKFDNIAFGLVWDNTYPYIVDAEIASIIPEESQTSGPIYKDDGQVVMFRDEMTCAYVFLKDGSKEQEVLVSTLPLHP